MNQEQLNAIKERVAKVSAGEWECRYIGHSRPQYSVVNAEEYVAHIYDVNDAEFIANAREDVPALVAEVEYLREMLRDTRKVVRQKVKEVKTLQNACKNHKAKQEVLEFHLKVSIQHAEELDSELEAEVTDNEQLRKALEKVMEVEAPIMEGWETPAYKIAQEALGGEAK